MVENDRRATDKRASVKLLGQRRSLEEIAKMTAKNARTAAANNRKANRESPDVFS
jgi:hypothetical protein